MEFETAKAMGAVGSILVVLTIAPYAGAILGLIGLILILVALNFFSDYYNRKEIFRNALIALIIVMVGMIAAIILGFALLVATVATFATPPPFGPPYPRIFIPPLGIPVFPLMLIAISIIIVFTAYLISAIFFRKSLIALSEASGEKMFSTAALLYLIGAILTIIIVGFIIVLVAFILLTVAFFAVKPKPTPT